MTINYSANAKSRKEIQDQSKVWRRMLLEMGPLDTSPDEQARTARVADMFNREARVAMIALLKEVDRAHQSEELLERELSRATETVREALRSLKIAREKNAKLRNR